MIGEVEETVALGSDDFQDSERGTEGHENPDAQGWIELERTLEGLLFLSAEPVTASTLADASGAQSDEVLAALARMRERFETESRGLVVRELAGGWTLSTHPDVEPAARRLLARPRTPPLTAAQAETLAIVAYLQPVSRPEIARIRGVSAESATQTLLERGIIEEAGRSQFGAVLYRTTDLFLKLFGLRGLGELPRVEGFDPPPELEHELRDRLLRAGEARAGIAGVVTATDSGSVRTDDAVPAADSGSVRTDDAVPAADSGSIRTDDAAPAADPDSTPDRD